MSWRRIGLGIGSFAFDKLVVAVVQILLVPVLANAWGLAVFGIWAMLATAPAFFALGDFGIVTSSWARMTRFLARGEVERARTSLHTACLVTLGIGALLALVLGALLRFLPAGAFPSADGFPVGEVRTTLALLVAYGFGTIVFRLVTAIFRAHQNLPLALWCNSFSYGAENLTMIAAVVSGADPVLAAGVLVGMRAISILLVVVIAFVKYSSTRPGFARASRAEWVEMWRPALAATALGIGLVGFLQGSVLVLGAVAGVVAVPAFVAVRTIARLGIQLSAIVSHPVAQEFGDAMAREEWGRAGQYFGLVAAVSAVLAVGAAAGLLLLGQPVVRIWTSGAIHAPFWLIAFMALSSFAAIIWSPLSSLIMALNRQRAISNVSFAASLAGLVLIFLLGERFGTAAGGLAYALVDLVTLAAVLAFLRRSWLADRDFRKGIGRSITAMRSPLVTWRAMRRGKPT